MEAFAIVLLSLSAVYGTVCGLFGAEPGAPQWLRWPVTGWNFIRFGRPAAPRPDYARIALLERELGFVNKPVTPASLAPDQAAPRGRRR